jgi:hypothetical protein
MNVRVSRSQHEAKFPIAATEIKNAPVRQLQLFPNWGPQASKFAFVVITSRQLV